ncbi:hypothetical protein CL648_03845 [bacterium]|nr:hypothetical protein [bacterium]
MAVAGIWAVAVAIVWAADWARLYFNWPFLDWHFPGTANWDQHLHDLYFDLYFDFLNADLPSYFGSSYFA